MVRWREADAFELFPIPVGGQQNSRMCMFGQSLVPSEGGHSEPWIGSSLQQCLCYITSPGETKALKCSLWGQAITIITELPGSSDVTQLLASSSTQC